MNNGASVVTDAPLLGSKRTLLASKAVETEAFAPETVKRTLLPGSARPCEAARRIIAVAKLCFVSTLAHRLLHKGRTLCSPQPVA